MPIALNRTTLALNRSTCALEPYDNISCALESHGIALNRTSRAQEGVNRSTRPKSISV